MLVHKLISWYILTKTTSLFLTSPLTTLNSQSVQFSLLNYLLYVYSVSQFARILFLPCSRGIENRDQLSIKKKPQHSPQVRIYVTEGKNPARKAATLTKDPIASTTPCCLATLCNVRIQQYSALQTLQSLLFSITNDIKRVAYSIYIIRTTIEDDTSANGHTVCLSARFHSLHWQPLNVNNH